MLKEPKRSFSLDLEQSTASKLLSVITAYIMSIPLQYGFHTSMVNEMFFVGLLVFDGTVSFQNLFIKTEFKPTLSRVFITSALGM